MFLRYSAIVPGIHQDNFLNDVSMGSVVFFFSDVL